MTCSDVEPDALVTICAWCLRDGRAAVPPDVPADRISHGICHAHRRAEFLAPKLYGAIARLRRDGWLSHETRAEIADDLERVVKALEMER